MPVPKIARSAQWVHALLHYDFCPRANRWVYWMKHPVCPLAAACAAALLCGLLSNPNVLALFAVLLGVLALGIAWPWIAIRRIECHMRFDVRRTREGQATGVSLEVVNHWPWPVWGLSLRRGFGRASADEAVLALAHVAGWSREEFRWEFRPAVRGVFPCETPQIETSFPFGFWSDRRPVAVDASLIVWPRSVALTTMPDAVEFQPLDERLSDRKAGDFGDIVGTRGFREGDSLRRVHWVQTARHGRLIVCERQAPAICAVELLVDLDGESHAHDASGDSLEQTLRIAASICESLHREHARVECRLGNESYSVGCCKSDLANLLDAMARVPQGGLQSEAGKRCRFHTRRHCLPRVTITTDRAFAKHLAHAHSKEFERFVVVRSGGVTELAQRGAAPCCRPWCEVSSAGDVQQEFVAAWRRACNAT